MSNVKCPWHWLIQTRRGGAERWRTWWRSTRWRVETKQGRLSMISINKRKSAYQYGAITVNSLPWLPSYCVVQHVKRTFCSQNITDTLQHLNARTNMCECTALEGWPSVSILKAECRKWNPLKRLGWKFVYRPVLNHLTAGTVSSIWACC